jgi:glycosyltransferase involved in cell wall biosynthesis
MNPKVSVLMAAYNVAAYIDEAIEAIRAQTFSDFEMIVIDDGSTDDTAARIEPHAKADGRIRLVRQANAGIPATRNKLVELARGEYLAVVDSDDVSTPTRLEQQARYLDEHPDCVAVSGTLMLIDPEGQELTKWDAPADHESIEKILLSGNGAALAHPAAMVRREAVLKAGGYRAGFPVAHDLDLFLRMARVGKLANLPDVMIKYRQHTGSICFRQPWKLADDAKRAVAAAAAARGITPQLANLPSTPESPAMVHTKWAWWAIVAGNKKIARKHAWRAVRGAPTSGKTWQVLFCALRGR